MCIRDRDGTVEISGEHKSYGNYLVIRHSDRLSTLYAHCSRLLVEAGEKVKAGEKIALVGMTGEATGPHLHFELIADGVRRPPETALIGGNERSAFFFPVGKVSRSVQTFLR